MLNDEKKKSFFEQLWDSLKFMKNPDNKVIQNFYQHPEIKYLGSSGIFSNRSVYVPAIEYKLIPGSILNKVTPAGYIHLEKYKRK